MEVFIKKHLGTFGKIGILSFNGNKTISSAGGGAILTNNKTLAKKARYLISNSKTPHKWKYSYNQIGYNYRMPNLNAAVGFLQLKYLNKILIEKRKLYKEYKKQFSKFDFIKIMDQPKFSKSNFWLQTLILDEKKTKYSRPNINEKLQKKNHVKACVGIITYPKSFKKVS